MMFEDIQDFHKHFELDGPSTPQLLDEDLYQFRLKFLREELQEFHDAHMGGDLVKSADALADLVYVALGTAYLMGIPMNLVWCAVHRANMSKVRAKRESDSKRGSVYDVVKPADFVSPEPLIKAALQCHGWKE